MIYCSVSLLISFLYNDYYVSPFSLGLQVNKCFIVMYNLAIQIYR